MPAVHLPQDRNLVAALPRIAGELEEAGFDGLWVGEVNDLDAVVPTALAAVGTQHAAIGVLLNTYTRAPTALAMTGATLADLAPGRMHIVLGSASPLLIERWNGIPYERPFARLRDCLRFMRRAFEGGRVLGEFETITTDGFTLGQAPATPPRLLVAACGPRSLRLAAEEADGVVLNWLTLADLERVETLPADPARVSMVVPVCPTSDRTVMEAVMRPILTDYLNAPAYADLQRRVGRGAALEQMWATWDDGDRRGARMHLPADVLDELVVWGSPAECRNRLDEMERAAGVRAIATYFPPRGSSFLTTALPSRRSGTAPSST